MNELKNPSHPDAGRCEICLRCCCNCDKCRGAKDHRLNICARCHDKLTGAFRPFTDRTGPSTATPK